MAFDIIIRSLNIVFCAVGLYYMLRSGNLGQTRFRLALFLILFSFFSTSIFSIGYDFTSQPLFHLLMSYPSMGIPVLLIMDLFLSMQFVEERSRETHNRQSSVLQTISTKINNMLDLKQIAKPTLEEMLEILNFDGASLYLASKRSEYLELIWSEGILYSSDVDISILSAKEVFSVFSMTEQGIIYDRDIIGNKEFQVCVKMEGMGIKKAVAVQLRSQREFIGIILLVSEKGMELSFEQKQFINDIAMWLSVAIRNAKLWEDLRKAYLKIVISFSKAVEAKDPYTSGHSENVASLSVKLASYLGLSKSEIEKIYMGARLHDIGKIGIPELMLNKTSALVEEEYRIIKEHAYKGYEITHPIDSMIKISDIVLHHHERYDGKGYPLGLSDERIPFLARIVAIADAFDAMISDRPYRKGISYKEALLVIEQNKGTQFDPVLAGHFVEMMKESIEAMEKGAERKDKPTIAADELMTLIGELASDVDN